MRSDQRVAALRSRIAEDGDIEALLVTKASNVVYVTGFDDVFDSEDSHCAVITADDAVLYTDSRYIDAATSAALGTEWRLCQARESLFVEVCTDLSDRGIETIAVESSAPHGRFRYISERFNGRVSAVDHWVEEVREVKDSEEIARIEAAQQLTDRTFEHILDVVREGMTERELSLEIEFFMRRNGSDGVAFPAIVASGPNSAYPHASVTDRVLERGDFLKLDFGARVDGYCADMTRTIVVGQASERHRELYDAVLSANLAGIEAVRAGRLGSEIDAVARAVIAEAGFGERFGHGLGHGVGLDVHELPSLGPRGSKPVPAGSVVTVEPGIYVPCFGGVRIEDLVVVEAGGCRVLSASPKHLMEV